MKTLPLFYTYPSREELDAKVIHVEQKGNSFVIELDQTIFYPEGGGQPSDQGDIVGSAGSMKVELVQNKDGRILHQGKITGKLDAGDAVGLKVKWGSRHHNMRVHTAGHLVHDVLMTMGVEVVPRKGNHGKKAFLEYQGKIDPSLKSELDRRVNEVLQSDLKVVCRDSSYEEIVAACKFVPPGLPKSKALRIIKIGDYPMMPDGGVHVEKTKDIGRIIIQEITSDDEKSVVKYRISGAADSDQGYPAAFAD